jgi:hypothetical protein
MVNSCYKVCVQHAVAQILTASNNLVATIPVGDLPTAVAFQPCTGIFSAASNGNLTVSAGQNFCIVNSVVNGNVTQTGGNLTVLNSNINGKVAISGASTFMIEPGTVISKTLEIQNLPASTALNEICGANVNGHLLFQSNGTPALIGGSGPSCPANTVGGTLEVQDNTASVTIVGDSVASDLEVENNAGATDVTGNTVTGNLTNENNTAPTQVFNNNISKTLDCENNTTITGGGNTAKKKLDQCATF